MALLRLFGHPVLERDGTRTALKVPAKAVALLSIIASNHLRPLSREWLAETLWPDSPASEALANLRRHLHLCLRAIDDDALTLTRTTVQWNAQSQTDVDVIRFDTFSQTQPSLAIQEYSGELCAGISDEILESLRPRYRSAYEVLLRDLIERARAAKDDSQLAVWLQRALNHDPFDETCVRETMELRARNGDRTGALREFNAFVQRLRSELSTEPEAETTALFHRIAGGADEPRIPNNLPNASTTFVGRANELAQLSDALRASRIVTLLGPGGIGKSRLAIRAARMLLPSYRDGAWFVPLDHAATEPAIWERVAQTLGLPASDDRRTAVIHAMEHRQALLIFDTCEQAVEPARRVAESLAAGTSATILATSRRKLNAKSERIVEVPPLDIPADDPGRAELMQFGAYRLFIERATAVSPAFRVSAADVRTLISILQRTDGLPLAIELVASRANVLTIEGMRKRLPSAMRAPHRSPASARAQTIDETIAWSYGLLTQKQQSVFRAVGAFAGTFDIEDVEQLCGGTADVALALFELVDASLVSVSASGNDVRYRLLDTTREFARRHLLEREGSQTLLRHAELFAHKAREIAAATEDRLGALLAQTLAAMPDYLCAIDNSREHGRIDYALQILEGIHRFGVRKHAAPEMLERIDSLLAAAGAATLAQRARLTRMAAMLTHDDLERNFALDVKAIELYQQLGDEVGLCDAMSAHAATLFYMGRNDQSERLLLEVCERAQRVGATRIYLKSAGRLGALINDYERAVEFLVPAVEQMLEIGELRQAAWAYRSLAACAFFSQRWEEAAKWADESLALFEKNAEPLMQALLATMRGCALQQAGRDAEAVRSHLRALPLCAGFEQYVETVECLEDMASTLAALGDCAPAARLVGYTLHTRATLGVPLTEQQLSYYGPNRENLAQRLGPLYELELTAGAQMSWSQAVQLTGERLAGLLERLQESEDTTSLS